MRFLIRKVGEKVKAHIWIEEFEDTACRMWSTGGLKQSRYEIRQARESHEICQMCLNNFAKLERSI